MAQFPISNLRPLSASLFKGALGKPSISVQFEPFRIPSPTRGDAEEQAFDFEAPLRADFIDLPSMELSSLQKRSFKFPVNPDDGFIDASVYFADVHNPVDITQLGFGDLSDGATTLSITSRWIMSFEGTGFDDFDYAFTVPIRMRDA